MNILKHLLIGFLLVAPTTQSFAQVLQGTTIRRGAGGPILTIPNATDTLTGKATSDVLTNKSYDADGAGNVLTNIDNGNIKSGAAIARDKLATGSNNHVIINDGSGVLSSEASLDVTRGGTGAATLTSNNVILGNGTSAVQFVAPGTSGNVLTSNGTTWASTSAAGGTPYAYSGFHDETCMWARTSTSFGDPAVDASCTLTERERTGFAAVTSYLSGGDKLPGIVITLETAYYYVCAVLHGFAGTAGASNAVQMTDGSKVVSTSHNDSDTTSDETRDRTLCGVYSAAAGSVTLRVTAKASSGSYTITGGQAVSAIEWSIFKI